MANFTVIVILFCLIKLNASVSEKLEQNNIFGEEDVEKLILIWQPGDYLRHMFGEGQEALLQNDCPVDNCFVTSNRNWFGGDLRKFDAILFDGSDQNWYVKGDLPKKRYNHQKYTYVQRESAELAYVCHTGYDNFFNWTMTYKLNSKFILPYIHLKDINEKIVGPKKNMRWNTNIPKQIDERLAKDLNGKLRAAAWFYSNCNISRTNYEFVKNLQRALQNYDLNIDVYGKCGPLHCSLRECDEILDKDYYFYLALEDSFAEDYVTGNVLQALRNNVVPVVYGGANYSRFLPPESYLDGTLHTPEELAFVMKTLIENKPLYARYFWWKSHYSFCLGHASPKLKGFSYCGKPVCQLCKSLHDPKKIDVRSVYRNFRKWWYPNYKSKCDKKHASDLFLNFEDEENALRNLSGSHFLKQKKEQKKIVKKKKPKGRKMRKGKKKMKKVNNIKYKTKNKNMIKTGKKHKKNKKKVIKFGNYTLTEEEGVSHINKLLNYSEEGERVDNKNKKNKKKVIKFENYTLTEEEGVSHINKLLNYSEEGERVDNKNKVKDDMLTGEGNVNNLTENHTQTKEVIFSNTCTPMNNTLIKEAQVSDKNISMNHTLQEIEKNNQDNIISEGEKSNVDLDSILRRSGSKDILDLLAEKIILRRMSMLSEKGLSGPETPDEGEKERSLSMFSNNIVLS